MMACSMCRKLTDNYLLCDSCKKKMDEAKRRKSIDKIYKRAFGLQQHDLLTDIDRGLDLEAEAEARGDELSRIYNKFLEIGD